ncbi:retrovirus-related pol polyprotein from transposon TNT 1-94 [Tanacetum coccineum]
MEKRSDFKCVKCEEKSNLMDFSDLDARKEIDEGDIATCLAKVCKVWDDWEVDRYGKANLGRYGVSVPALTKDRRPQDPIRPKAQEAGQILDEEQLAFLADPRISEALVAQQTIPQNLAFQTEDFDAYDSDYDDVSSTKAVLMANLSSCDPEVLSELSIDNDQLLKQIMSQEIVHIAVNSVDSFDVKKSCVNECNKCLELETKLLKKKDLIEKNVYDKLLKSYSTLEKHCISLELATQLNQEIFQRENYGENLKAPTFNRLFEINELKAQSQEKDTVIRKLKDRIKSLSGKDSVENVKKDIDEIETINIELEHSVAKLLSENENLRKEREHLKSIYKDQFDSIRKTRVQSKEHCDSLIAQINAKSVENSDLNAQLQEKVFAIAALKNELRKLKGKNVVDTAISKPSTTIAPRIFKLDIEPISHRLQNNRDAHEVYLEKTIENTDTLHGFIEGARKHNPSEPLLEAACIFTKYVQELLVYVSKTCPNLTKPCKKLVAITPMNEDKKVRFVEPVTSRSNQKNKVEEHPRKVKASLNKMNFVSESTSNAHVKHSVRNAKFESICAICNKCLFDANHDMYVIDYVNDVNVRSKSKINKMRKVWKPMGKVFFKIQYSWKPTCRTFTIFGNKCPLTRIISTNEVPLKETIITPMITQSLALKVYSRKLKASRSVGSSSNAKIVESKTSNTKEPKQSWGSTVYDVPSFSLNDCSVDLLKASKTKSWLWHRRLSYLNFDYITSLSKQGLVRGLPKLKYQKDHLCSACALGKSKKHSHKPKAEDSIQEKLYLLNMDLYGPIRIQSINGIKYILVIIDDYSRCVDPQVPAVIAPDAAVSTGTPSLTIIDLDVPSTITSQTNQETPTPVIPHGV